jgi:hypothetical protein
MTPAKVIARLRRLAEDWRREEARLCEQFGDVIASQSMRARQIKDTQAIDAAIEMIERLESAEKERDNANAAAVNIALEAERLQCENDALRAKITEMEKQEPVAWLDDGTCRAGSDSTALRIVTEATKQDMPASVAASFSVPLYALPGAKGE